MSDTTTGGGGTTTLRYAVTSRWFTSGGHGTVHEGDRRVAAVELEPGMLLTGPTWTWTGALGTEWVMRAERGDSTYELRGPDGEPVGRLQRPWLTSGMHGVTADGARVEVASRRMFSRDWNVGLPGGRHALVTRTSPPALFGSAESWEVALPTDLAGHARSLLLAVPLALDHHRRRQRSSGAGAGAAG